MEGNWHETRHIDLESLSIDHDLMKKCHFQQGDASRLHHYLKGFDLVLAANLIDRLQKPLDFLNHIHERINPGGFLVISSPYTWLEAHTDPSDWLGGYRENGELIHTLSTLKRVLGAHFNLVSKPRDIPFVIRETQRKFQHSIAELSIWQKK